MGRDGWAFLEIIGRHASPHKCEVQTDCLSSRNLGYSMFMWRTATEGEESLWPGRSWELRA
jgi:hypothetical protein